MSFNTMTYIMAKKYVDKAVNEAQISSISPEGIWEVEKYYPKDTVISSGGKIYIAIQDAPPGTEIVDENYWNVLFQDSNVLNLEGAAEGQIPYLGPDGKIIWNNIALRRDNDYNYKKIENTFIPVNGEICLVDVAGHGLRAKVGDGVHTFAQLSYSDEAILNNIYSLIIKGYYYQDKFYLDAEHTQLIEDVIGRICIDAISGKIYTYNGVNYETQGGSLPNATANIAGVVKLYETLGQNTDGTMTQKAITDELNEKIEMDVVKEEEMIVFDFDIN